MPSEVYLAITAAEFERNPPLAWKIAYMACHFAPYGLGISNLPANLPEGSMVILNDRTPVMGHSPELVAHQLWELAENQKCSRILLDFQRPGEKITQEITQAILSGAPCPVGVSEHYARQLDCPVFLPPLPLNQTVEECMQPWEGREIWMEAAMDAAAITLTPQGSTYAPCPPPGGLPYYDGDLLCHYGIDLQEEKAVFTLHRSWQALQELMKSDQISCFVGLFQELRNFI